MKTTRDYYENFRSKTNTIYTFSSKRKYSCINDASVDEQHDCFKESVILPVSLFTWKWIKQKQ